MIKTYRGQLPGNDAGSKDSIPLHTTDGKIGYRVKKFQTIQKSPGAQHCEGLVILWKTDPTAAEIATKTIDLQDNRILGMAFYSANSSANTYPEDMTIIFDNQIVNQDIFISYIDVSTTNDAMNYYLELEQIKLSETEALVSIVKNLRTEQ